MTCTNWPRPSSPEDTINRVCYFTARLEIRPGDQGQPQRQLIYLRALETLPDVYVYYGYFRSGFKRRPLAVPVPGLPSSVLVRNSEEKGSDVNLATRLLVDGFNGECEQAVVVSNDADFAGAIRFVRDGLGVRVVVVNPDPPQSEHKEPGRFCDLREAPLEESLEAKPVSQRVDGRNWNHHQTTRMVRDCWSTCDSQHGMARGFRIEDRQRRGV